MNPSVSELPSLAKRVMIADEQPGRFAPIARTLEEAGIVVTYVEKRELIVPTALKFKPDLVIMNLFFGNAPTLPLIRKITDEVKDINVRVLVLTRHKSAENIKEAVKAGATDFVVDPFEPRFLLQRIRYQLQEREAYSPEDLRSEPVQMAAGFQLVYDCLRIIAEVAESHQALHEVLKKMADLSQSQRINIVLGDVETGEGSVLVSSDDPKLSNLKVDLERYPEVREVLLRGSIVFIKDVTQNPLVKEAIKKVESVQINSLLLLPIRHRRETIGALSIRLGAAGLEVSDKHLKTFFMLAMAMASKVAAKRLMSQKKAQASV